VIIVGKNDHVTQIVSIVAEARRSVHTFINYYEPLLTHEIKRLNLDTNTYRNDLNALSRQALLDANGL
jgi:hypothetical protein